MDTFSAFAFVYSTDTAYLSVETPDSGKTLKVGCIGMGPVWGIPDHTWDYPLDDGLKAELIRILNGCSFETWDECYASADEPGLQWDFIVGDAEGNRRRSWGMGMKSENLDCVLGSLKELVFGLSQTVFIDLSDLEAVYFCHVANKINFTATFYRDMETKFERTGTGERETMLTSGQWEEITELVADPGLNRFGFRKEAGSQFLSVALYLGGKMVSYTYGGTVDPKWDVFEDKLLKILGI